jgi:hypothetical protein
LHFTTAISDIRGWAPNMFAQKAPRVRRQQVQTRRRQAAWRVAAAFYIIWSSMLVVQSDLCEHVYFESAEAGPRVIPINVSYRVPPNSVVLIFGDLHHTFHERVCFR